MNRKNLNWITKINIEFPVGKKNIKIKYKYIDFKENNSWWKKMWQQLFNQD